MKLYWPLKPAKGATEPNIGQLFGEDFFDQKIGGLHYKTLYNHKGHEGLDFPIPSGNDVFYIHDGYLVEATGKTGGFGIRVTQVWLDEENPNEYYLAVYGHLQDFVAPEKIYNFADKSTPIKAGDKLGHSDNTGDSSGPHLHVGLYKYDLNGNKLNSNNGYGGAIDPLPYFRKETMTNSLIVQNGGEYGIYDPATSEDGLITLMRNRGFDVPLTAEGKLDWSKLNITKQLIEKI